MAKLYQKCEHCKGTKYVQPPPGSMLRGSVACDCYGSETPGFWPVGLTMGQVESIIADRDNLLTAVYDFANGRAADGWAAELVRGRAGEAEEAGRKLGRA